MPKFLRIGFVRYFFVVHPRPATRAQFPVGQVANLRADCEPPCWPARDTTPAFDNGPRPLAPARQAREPHHLSPVTFYLGLPAETRIDCATLPSSAPYTSSRSRISSLAGVHRLLP